MEISATDPATGNPVALASGHRYVPPAAEALDYDEDGNLIEDARGNYQWDAEPSRGTEARRTQPCASRVRARAERPNQNRLIWKEEKARAVGGGVDPASLPPRKRLTFAYDARHRRIAKWVHEWDDASSSFSKLVKDLRFLYDGWSRVEGMETRQTAAGWPPGRVSERGERVNMTVELDHTFATGDGLAGSRPVREFFWGPDLSGTMEGAGGVGGLLAVFYQGVSYQVCTDANGNVSALYASSGPQKGTVAARFDYDPYGNRITNTGVDAEICPFGFSTKYRDEETGLYYYGFRYYSPELGRWLNSDPIGEDGGINVNGFVNNDPVDWYDYLGREPRNSIPPDQRIPPPFNPTPSGPVSPSPKGIPTPDVPGSTPNDPSSAAADGMGLANDLALAASLNRYLTVGAEACRTRLKQSPQLYDKSSCCACCEIRLFQTYTDRGDAFSVSYGGARVLSGKCGLQQTSKNGSISPGFSGGLDPYDSGGYPIGNEGEWQSPKYGRISPITLKQNMCR